MSEQDSPIKSLIFKCLNGLKLGSQKIQLSWILHGRIAHTDEVLRRAVHNREAVLCVLGRDLEGALKNWPGAPENLVVLGQTLRGLRTSIIAIKAKIDSQRTALSTLRQDHNNAIVTRLNSTREGETNTGGQSQMLGDLAQTGGDDMSSLGSREHRPADNQSENAKSIESLRSTKEMARQDALERLDLIIQEHVQVRDRIEGVLIELGAQGLQTPEAPVSAERRQWAIEACRRVDELQEERRNLLKHSATLGLPGGRLGRLVIGGIILLIVALIAMTF